MKPATVHVASPPPLVGRAEELRVLVDMAAGRPGALVIAGPPGAGATRLAREAGMRLALDGAVVVSAEGPGHGEERLRSALEQGGHDPDPARASRRRPIVVLLGDQDDDPGLAGRLAERLSGTRALALVTARREAPDASTLVLGPLDAAASHALARAAAPEIGEAALGRVLAVAAGLPGRIVPIARAARTWEGDSCEAPPVPDEIAGPIRARLAELAPWPLEVARWAAIVGGEVEAPSLARVCRHAPAAIERGLDELATHGVLAEVPGPHRPRFRFADPLAPTVVAAGLSGRRRRERHAAALVAARAARAGPAALLRHALGAADPPAVVSAAAAAAAEAREAGDHGAALSQAERALAWWTAELGPAARLAALHERGLARLDLSDWAGAAADLDAAAAGWAELGRPERELGARSAGASARWMAGEHEAAFRALRDHLAAGPGAAGSPSPARAEALTDAAGMAVMTARFAEATALAGRARVEATATGAAEAAARALVFMGSAEAGRGGPGALAHLERAREEGERAGGQARRVATLAAIHESHVLLAQGAPDHAAARAREGLARARELGLRDHELVLEGNLGEALAALGALPEARARLERAGAGWAGLARRAPTPADSGIAWLLLAEGRIDEALRAYRALASGAEPALFEHAASVATGHALAAAVVGRAAEAEEALAGALGAWAATDDRLTVIPLLAAAADAGPPEEAARRVEALRAMAAAGSPLADAFHSYADGRLRAREGSGGARALRAASGLFTALGMRWWSARALHMAGLAGGRGERAADDLLAARRRYREMGAGGWRRRIEARLRAMGRRIPTRARGTAPPTPAELSARELEVLEHLALGLRNRDIGERLYISERTVARHVAQILAKLGAPTRTAAARAARERGLLDVERTS